VSETELRRMKLLGRMRHETLWTHETLTSETSLHISANESALFQESHVSEIELGRMRLFGHMRHVTF